MKTMACSVKKNHWLRKSVFLVIACCLMNMVGTVGHASETSSSGFRVHLLYAEGKWTVGDAGVVVLPCEPPSKFIRGATSDPLFEVIGEKGETVITRHIRNPRRVFWEEPTEAPSLVEKTEYFLKFAFIPGMETLAFWESPKEQADPSLVVDLREAIEIYWEKGGPEMDAPCKLTPAFFNVAKLP